MIPFETRLAACVGKERYANRGEAKATLKRIESRKHKRFKKGNGAGKRMPYQCCACGGWHIGSDKT